VLYTRFGFWVAPALYKKKRREERFLEGGGKGGRIFCDAAVHWKGGAW